MKNLLTVKNLDFVFPGGDGNQGHHALKNFSMELKKENVTLLVGPNGAGKSTLIFLLTGINLSHSHSIDFDGQSTPDKKWKSRLGFMPEKSSLPLFMTPDSLLRLLFQLVIPAMNRRIVSRKIDELLSLVGLSEVSNKRMSGFSKGMLQRVSIAQMLINDPEFIVMDEPMSGLDESGQQLLMSLVKKFKEDKKTVLISTHKIDEFKEYADQVIEIKAGELAFLGDAQKYFFNRNQSVSV